MIKIISLITLLLFSIATHADDFDILGTWYQYEADQAGIDGIWVFNANYTGTHEEFYHGESEGVRNFTYTFDAANCILAIYSEGDDDDPFVMNITIVSPTEFTYTDGYDVLRWVRQPTDGTGIIGNWMDKKSSGITYNLSGQQLTIPRKGINIINGKKVVIK